VQYIIAGPLRFKPLQPVSPSDGCPKGIICKSSIGRHAHARCAPALKVLAFIDGSHWGALATNNEYFTSFKDIHLSLPKHADLQF